MSSAIPLHNIDEHTLPAQLHVASFIVHVRPAAIEDIAAWLTQQPRVEIYTRSEEGKFAVVMESDHEHAVLELLDRLTEQPGVLNAALIYHEIIDGEEDA